MPTDATKPVEIGPNEFRCCMCDGVFAKGWSDEEAIAELDARLPGHETLGQADLACEDCFKAAQPQHDAAAKKHIAATTRDATFDLAATSLRIMIQDAMVKCLNANNGAATADQLTAAIKESVAVNIPFRLEDHMTIDVTRDSDDRAAINVQIKPLTAFGHRLVNTMRMQSPEGSA